LPAAGLAVRGRSAAAGRSLRDAPPRAGGLAERGRSDAAGRSARGAALRDGAVPLRAGGLAERGRSAAAGRSARGAAPRDGAAAPRAGGLAGRGDSDAIGRSPRGAALRDGAAPLRAGGLAPRARSAPGGRSGRGTGFDASRFGAREGASAASARDAAGRAERGFGVADLDALVLDGPVIDRLRGVDLPPSGAFGVRAICASCSRWPLPAEAYTKPSPRAARMAVALAGCSRAGSRHQGACAPACPGDGPGAGSVNSAAGRRRCRARTRAA
jgi:hypothetical protein